MVKYVVTDRLGQAVNKGDEVTSFRDAKGTFEGVSRGGAPGKTAKVIVDGRENYATVWGLTVTEE
jgi:GTPase involved in cell partitioning and DNA repair